MCVCAYVLACVYLWCICIRICACMRVYVLYMCVHAYVLVYLCMWCICVCMRMCLYTCVCGVYVCVCGGGGSVHTDSPLNWPCPRWCAIDESVADGVQACGSVWVSEVTAGHGPDTVTVRTSC